tara:strand:- start:2293 stop:3039 length:747 start_codon:yes stop_codon:yes gene_type:complete
MVFVATALAQDVASMEPKPDDIFSGYGTVISAFFGSWIVFYVGHKAKEVAVNATKAQQLIFLDKLGKERALTIESRTFAVEEAFKHYLGVHIPKHIIKLFWESGNTSRGLESYTNVAEYVEYDESSKKIKSLSTCDIRLKVVSNILCSIAFTLGYIISSTWVLNAYNEELNIQLIMQLIVCTAIAIGTFYSAIKAWHSGWNTNGYFKEFKKWSEHIISEDEISNNTDKIKLVSAVFFIIVCIVWIVWI